MHLPFSLYLKPIPFSVKNILGINALHYTQDCVRRYSKSSSIANALIVKAEKTRRARPQVERKPAQITGEGRYNVLQPLTSCGPRRAVTMRILRAPAVRSFLHTYTTRLHPLAPFHIDTFIHVLLSSTRRFRCLSFQLYCVTDDLDFRSHTKNM